MSTSLLRTPQIIAQHLQNEPQRQFFYTFSISRYMDLVLSVSIHTHTCVCVCICYIEIYLHMRTLRLRTAAGLWQEPLLGSFHLLKFPAWRMHSSWVGPGVDAFIVKELKYGSPKAMQDGLFQPQFLHSHVRRSLALVAFSHILGLDQTVYQLREDSTNFRLCHPASIGHA